MEKMKELYAKVAEDAALQAKFVKILEEGAEAGEATKEKLLAFAKEASHEVTFQEAQEFFKALAKRTEGSVSEAELDLVAGGKTDSIPRAKTSLLNISFLCDIKSAVLRTDSGEIVDCLSLNAYDTKI